MNIGKTNSHITIIKDFEKFKLLNETLKSDKKNIEKIFNVGLIPKTKNTRSFYPERIYLSPDIKWMNSIKDQLMSEKEGDFINLKIKNFNGLSLYKDLRFPGGFYS